ncbi:MAG: hypothetical protein K5649_09455 [Lachnospiraceae bacterium]|nr:hypothetical protein [Lachnospiraceae bacterium]
MAEMDSKSRLFEVPAGTTILSEGECNLDMYKIVKGEAEMYVGYGTDHETLVGIIDIMRNMAQTILKMNKQISMLTNELNESARLGQQVQDEMRSTLKEYTMYQNKAMSGKFHTFDTLHHRN